MQVSDFIMEYLYNKGVRNIFMVPGGGSVKLCTSLMESKINPVLNHDEQACGFAAEASARYTGELAVVLVTSGPGVTNTLTAVAEAYFSSSPCLFISGQVTMNHTVGAQGIEGLRQIGVQEIHIVPIVEKITKYATMIEDPSAVKFHLDEAIRLATEGRPGPVWLDIPVDIQGASIEDGLDSEAMASKENCFIDANAEDIKYVIDALKEAKRPIFLIGQGVRLAAAGKLIEEFIVCHHIPVVASYLGIDILPRDLSNNMRNIGFKGTRYGNIAVQDADLILAIGSRLSIATVGYNSRLFGRGAKIIAVDIDSVEHSKDTIALDKFIYADAKCFMEALISGVKDSRLPVYTVWLEHCKSLKKKYPVCSDVMRAVTEGGLNPYHVLDVLTDIVPATMPIVADTGSALFVTSQCGNFKRGQRYIPSGFATMGYSLPAAIGISVTDSKANVVALTGDGSVQMNLQELQTIVHNALPIKIFVFNNNAYYTMKPALQRGYNAGVLYEGLKKHLSFPDFKKIAFAYDIKYISISTQEDMDTWITEDVLNSPEAIMFDVLTNENIEVYTVTTFHEKDGSIRARPIEDMFPFLDKEELYGQMELEPVY